MANFLGGAMRALSRSPKTAKFVDTLNHADLPEVPDEYYEAAQ